MPQLQLRHEFRCQIAAAAREKWRSSCYHSRILIFAAESRTWRWVGCTAFLASRASIQPIVVCTYCVTGVHGLAIWYLAPIDRDIYLENWTYQYICCVTLSTYLLTVDHAMQSLCAIFFIHVLCRWTSPNAVRICLQVSPNVYCFSFAAYSNVSLPSLYLFHSLQPTFATVTNAHSLAAVRSLNYLLSTTPASDPHP